jgi:hypothetical protein
MATCEHAAGAGIAVLVSVGDFGFFPGRARGDRFLSEVGCFFSSSADGMFCQFSNTTVCWVLTYFSALTEKEELGNRA